MAKATDDDESLKRLGGGRWQTRDERFTIEPQSGTWVVVDGEQTDDLGLPLIRGPFGSLGSAKQAIATARTSAAPVKALPRPAKAASPAGKGAAPLAKRSRIAASTGAHREPAKATPAPAPTPPAAKPAKPVKDEPPAEPRWISDLSPPARRRARASIKRLSEAGAPDPEGMTRRDVSGGVPAIAAFAVTRRIRALGPDASPEAVAGVLADGRDDELDVRWRVVDGDGRPIPIQLGTPERKRGT